MASVIKMGLAIGEGKRTGESENEVYIHNK